MVKDSLSRLRLARQLSAMFFVGSLALSAAACGDDEDGGEDGSADGRDGTPDGGDGEPTDGSDGEPNDGSDGSPGSGDLFAVMSAVYGAEGTTTYLSLVDALAGQTLDFGQAREFAGGADLWLHEGALFVTQAESQSITKFTLEGDTLVEGDTISFTNFGFTSSFGFWLNSFVAADKAYLLNPSALTIVTWNPATMEIGTEVEIGTFENEGALVPYPSYTDRASVLHGTQLFVPIYWASASFSEFLPTSQIIVIDTTTDTVLDTLEAGCPGLDFATVDAEDNLYFSSWVFAPGGAALLEQPATCVVKVTAGATPAVETAFTVKDLTEGREGGVFKFLGDGKAQLSILHRDNAPDEDEFPVVTYGKNWRFWTYDFAAGTATVNEDYDFNAGGAYYTEIGGEVFMLVPASDYASTELFSTIDATSALKTGGWTTRVFQVR